jgi:hypothetical protein
MDPRHNGGPPLEDALTLQEAQTLPDIQLRPSYVQRYAGAGSPLRPIVGLGRHGSFGQWTLLKCGHWREIRDYNIAPALGRNRPKASRCGCCRLGYLPTPEDKARAEELTA